MTTSNHSATVAGRGTHEVVNQGSPFADVDLFETNRPLRDALAVHAPALDTTRLQALGREAGSTAMQEHARAANVHPPELRTHDRFGRRIDEVVFHPSYHALMACAMGHGLHATPWAPGAARGGHLRRAAGFMLFTELEPSVLCPISMTYAVAPALRAHAALNAQWLPRLAACEYDARFVPVQAKTSATMGMGMTEKQGGSDVRANTTRAVKLASSDDAPAPTHALTGHKWFMSAPMCDAFLVLAQADAGLSCFFVPRVLDDGSTNPIRIQRLKDKLGNKANASSEVEFDGTVAWLIGEEGRGVQQILEMGTLTRLDCALGTAGLMRHALSLALHHARERMAFGKRLADHALMKSVLADLALESEAATALALRLAHAVDASAHGNDPHEAALRRVLTPLAKFWICKRGSLFAQEAMECLGGNGYVEEGGRGVMARIYREMPLNSIWEGAGNIMALDLMRALRNEASIAALRQAVEPARGLHSAVDRALETLPSRLDGGTDEAQARTLARDVSVLVQAALLRQHAPAFVAEGFARARVAAGSDVFGALPAGIDVDGLIGRALPA
jgi:putative acyl-CoA dehydrogenase